jgi:F-type H+-transporting ATPase subunit epsilon
VVEKKLQLVLVTPETTLLDEPVLSLRFPLFDGQIGILPGRAPLVGRLGYGELIVFTAEGKRSYFVDGGFVQVSDSVVSVLTNRSMPIGEIDRTEAEELLQKSREMVPTTDHEFATKSRNQERARRMLEMSGNQSS